MEGGDGRPLDLGRLLMKVRTCVLLWTEGTFVQQCVRGELQGAGGAVLVALVPNATATARSLSAGIACNCIAAATFLKNTSTHPQLAS
jgi:hypothetical protein